MYKVLSHKHVPELIEQIFNQVNTKIEDVELIKDKLSSYSSNRIIAMTNEVGEQIFAKVNYQNNIEDGKEPNKLEVDNFVYEYKEKVVEQIKEKMSAFTFTCEQSMNKKSSVDFKKTNMASTAGSRSTYMLPNEKEKRKIAKNSSIKLEGLISMEDEKEIDDIIEFRAEKIEEEKERKRIEVQRENHRRNIRRKREGVNFDYSGKIIEIRSEKRNNLVSKSMIGLVKKEVSKKGSQKISKLEVEPIFVTTQKVKDIEEEKPKRARTEIVKRVSNPREKNPENFTLSQISNPFEKIEIEPGVRAQFESNILENKVKAEMGSEEAIRRSITSRSINRKQYNNMLSEASLKVRIIAKANKNIKTVENKFENESEESVMSPKLSLVKKRTMTDLDESIVKVQDQSLREFLLKETEFEDFREGKESCIRPTLTKEDHSKIQNDMNCHLKNSKNLLGVVIRRSTHMQNVKLYPKVRDRGRETYNLRKEGSKKFEESLRI